MRINIATINILTIYVLMDIIGRTTEELGMYLAFFIKFSESL